jgi:hypothetical protein
MPRRCYLHGKYKRVGVRGWIIELQRSSGSLSGKQPLAGETEGDQKGDEREGAFFAGGELEEHAAERSG